MKNRRNIAIAASISCLLGAPLAMAPGAQADELADLRVNQELLQKRLDQLAQIPGAGHLYQGPGAAKTANKEIVGGSFPRSFLIPGTDTSIRIGGSIRFHMMHFFTGGAVHTAPASTTNFGNNGAIFSAPLHVHVLSIGPGPVVKTGNPARSLGNDLTFFSPQQSKINFETRTPTAWGEARTFMEFDWAGGSNGELDGSLRGTNSLQPRLRYAYATLGGLLGGQANSNFADPDAGVESLNFGGMTGGRGVTRIPQIRYTWPLAPWGSLGAFSVSAEAPETEGWVRDGFLESDNNSVGGTSGAGAGNPFKAPSPDLTAAWYIPQTWGHMDFGAVVRPALQMKDGQFFDRSFTGYGVAFSGDVKPHWFGWNKDFITWQFTYGDGEGRYIGGIVSALALVSNYGGPVAPGVRPGTPAAARLVRARTVTGWGGETGYRHWWSPTLRSNVGFGIFHQDINNLGGIDGFVCSGAARFSGGAGCGLNKEVVTSEVNLIWNPVPFADLGIEYFWGHRLVLSNLKGDVSGVISRFAVNF